MEYSQNIDVIAYNLQWMFLVGLFPEQYVKLMTCSLQITFLSQQLCMNCTSKNSNVKAQNPNANVTQIGTGPYLLSADFLYFKIVYLRH